MISCKRAAVLMSKELDGELSRGVRFLLRCHLLVCVSCSRVMRQLRLLKQAAATLQPEDDLPNSALRDVCLSPEARERIKNRLRKKPEAP